MSFTRLRYHIVFSTKRRRRSIDAKLEAFLYPVLINSIDRNDGSIIRLGGVEDHVHIICGLRPVACLSDFVERIKCESAGAVRRNMSAYRGFKWQKEFSAFTLSALDYQDAVSYVENQKDHHRRGDLWKPFEELVEDLEESGDDGDDGDDTGEMRRAG